MRDRLAGELSHGQKQWLEIGMLLVQGRELLLLDEPVAGMTDAETEATAELLRELARPPHHRRRRARHGVRAGAGGQGHGPARGPVLAEGSVEQVQADPRVIEVYLGR